MAGDEATGRRGKDGGAGERGRRGEILAAAVASVVEDGYGRTSMAHVARRAGVPRPLVQYYFPTRELMLRAAIGRILSDWQDDYLEPPAQAGGALDIVDGVERLWRHLHQPSYRAYRELQSAARTDAPLAAMLAELGAAAEHHRHGRAVSAYAAFATADPSAFTDARAFTTVFLEGLLQHGFGAAAESSTPERQLAMLTDLLAHYWSRHGLRAIDAAPPPVADRSEMRDAAERMIGLLQDLIKTTG